jgi:hypothetical protein
VYLLASCHRNSLGISKSAAGCLYNLSATRADFLGAPAISAAFFPAPFGAFNQDFRHFRRSLLVHLGRCYCVSLLLLSQLPSVAPLCLLPLPSTASISNYLLLSAAFCSFPSVASRSLVSSPAPFLSNRPIFMSVWQRGCCLSILLAL